MAGEKIYPATPYKRKKAREEGQVAKSTELITLLILFFSLLFINMNRASLYTIMRKFLRILELNIDGDIDITIYQEFFKILLLFLAPLFIIVAITAFLGNYFQVGFMFTPKVLKPNFKKIDPISGFKKMFSKDILVELLKSLLKVTGVLIISFTEIQKISSNMSNAYTDNPTIAFNYIFDSLFGIVIKISILLLALAILDFIYKKYKFESDLKMSRQDVMDEHKMMEGNPMIKQKQREFGRMLTKKQIQTVKEATVVITNPTHYAIALKYDRVTHPAPIVLFRGVDEIAQAAKKIAAENNIPMVENRPVARALYAQTKEGDTIPQEMYQSVASILSYVYMLNDKKI